MQFSCSIKASTALKNPIKMKDEIYMLIRSDKYLRRSIADALDVDPNTIYRHAVKKADSLNKPLVIAFIAKQLGKTVKEISE